MSDLKMLKSRKRTLETLIAGASYIAGSKGIPARHQWVGVTGEALEELMKVGGVRITCSLPDLNQLNALKSSLDEEIREVEREALIAQFKAAPAPAPAPAAAAAAALPSEDALMAMVAKVVAAAMAAQAPKPNP